MKKKGMLIFIFLMRLCNTLTMYYVNRALKQEINIYVVQVGRYKEKANAENTMKQIEELGYKSSMYQDQEYVVITDIFMGGDIYRKNRDYGIRSNNTWIITYGYRRCKC